MKQPLPTSSRSEVITGWFARTGGGSLVLPDGWFGRPYDNLHRLTFLEERPHKLLLELDEQLLLTFTELETVRIADGELLLTDFRHLTFDWQGYGDPEGHVHVYREGTVRLVPPAGG